MSTNDNLFYELMALKNISEEARKLYFEIMATEDKMFGDDLLIICKDSAEVKEELSKIARNYPVNWEKKCVKTATTNILYFRTLQECKDGCLTGYKFRRIMFN